jgi:hypothetical protein
MRNGLIIDKYGNRAWYQNDQLHRIDGPAIERTDGTKIWHFEGQAHRINGPAVEYPDGDKYWYIRGVRYDFNDWLNLVNYTEPQKTLMRLQYA